ncbi:MAG: MFS transporter [Clostridia bacterium]|nr:MFS transporter [Clostridia bacterium]
MNFKRTKHTCYFTYLAMSSAFSLPPMLFMIFREQYGISYTLLGTLVLVNFCTQLTIDLIFSFFTKFFNIHKTIRTMPLLTSAGFLIYALVPTFFPQFAYVGLLIGTVVFSVAAGLCEVLISPIVAALPSENPERDMSMLHSLYAWGVLTVVLVSTLFLQIFGNENWMYLTVFWALIPIFSAVLFCIVPLPEMDISHQRGKAAGKRQMGMALCIACIFLGSAAENGMTNWISAFAESALQIPKALGDILGLALFAVLLGSARTLYAKYGKNIMRVLLFSAAGAIVCYLVAGLSPIPALSLVACVLTGFCTSMLWPGTLILMEEKLPAVGVTAYALMAAGGDLGGSVAPQMLGGIVDGVSATEWAHGFSSLTAEQVGMKVGMLVAVIFPILCFLLLLYMKKYFKNQKNESDQS